jgi:pimeloyl-ACP methyl ester carboxylesterase
MHLLFPILAIVLVIIVVKLCYFVWLEAQFPEPMLADETHTVVTEDSWPIRLYRRTPASGSGEPVFLPHALGANHLNYEVPVGHSLVDALVEAGYDCWTMDYRGDRSCPPPKGMSRRNVHVDDYLTKDIPAALQHIHETTGYDQVHWIGHSMGGMLLYAYEALFGREQIASAVTFGSPIGFKDTRIKNAYLVAVLAAYCPPLLSAGIRGGSPFARFVKPQVPGLPINWDNMHEGVDTQAHYNMLEVPPGGVSFDMNHWAMSKDWKMLNGDLDVAAKLRKSQLPLLAFFSKLDPFVNLADAQDFMDNLPTDDKAMVVLSKEEGCDADYNHCDIPFSTNADIEVFPHVTEWIQEHPIGAKPAAPKRSFRVESAAKLAADALGLSDSAPAAKNLSKPEKPKAKPATKTPKAKKSSAKPKAKAATKKAAAKKPSKKKAATKPRSKPKASPKKPAAKKKVVAKKPASKSKSKSSAKKKAVSKKKTASKPKAAKKKSK